MLDHRVRDTTALVQHPCYQEAITPVSILGPIRTFTAFHADALTMALLHIPDLKVADVNDHQVGLLAVLKSVSDQLKKDLLVVVQVQADVRGDIVQFADHNLNFLVH